MMACLLSSTAPLSGGWQVAIGKWQIEHGKWQIEHGKWQMAD
jgi:hypothetical protein